MCAGEQTIYNAMMVSKGITVLEQTDNFHKDIREQRKQTTDLKALADFNKFIHQAHRERRISVTTIDKGGYIEAV